MPRFADATIRQRYLESIGERPLFTEIQDRLAELGKLAGVAGTPRPKVAFDETPDGKWRARDTRELVGAD